MNTGKVNYGVQATMWEQQDTSQQKPYENILRNRAIHPPIEMGGLLA